MAQRLKFFVEQWAWFVVRRQVKISNQPVTFELELSDSNRISKLTAHQIDSHAYSNCLHIK